MKQILAISGLLIFLLSCAGNPVDNMLRYRNNYDVELIGFNVKSDESGEPKAVNLELSVENRNSEAYMSVLTLRIRQYGADNEVLGEDLLALPLKGLEGYRTKRYYPVINQIHGNIAAISVTKAPVDDPNQYMKYREFSGLPKQ